MDRVLKDFYIKGDNVPPLRQVLNVDYKSPMGELPIKGGWGYTLEDAIIIDKNDPIVDPNLPFDGVGIEYIIVEKRLIEELVNFTGDDEMLGFINWDTTQKLMSVNGKHYDHLKIKGSAFYLGEFHRAAERLMKKKPQIKLEEFQQKLDELKVYFESDYYFDISSFYPKR